MMTDRRRRSLQLARSVSPTAAGGAQRPAQEDYPCAAAAGRAGDRRQSCRAGRPGPPACCALPVTIGFVLPVARSSAGWRSICQSLADPRYLRFVGLR